MFFPVAAIESNVLLMAAMPELTAITSAAFVSNFTLFSKKGYCRIRHSGIVWYICFSAKGIGHFLCVVKLIGCRMINWHTQGIVGILALEPSVDCLGLFFSSLYSYILILFSW